jgi:nucleoside-diphosphate-sugar epimerase
LALLVTGGTGFLGSYLVRYALTRGNEDRVIVFDRYPDRGRLADLLDRIQLVEGDISDAEQVERVVRAHDIDRIAHFAFILGSPSPGQMQAYVKVQLLGTANLLEAARTCGVKRVLFASSVAAYGNQSADVLHEDLIPNPRDPYGAAKVWCESTTRHFHDHLDLDTVTIRYGSTYGLGRAARGSYCFRDHVGTVAGPLHGTC